MCIRDSHKKDQSKDKTLKIDFSQFLEIMIKKMSEKDSNEDIQAGFKLFDLNEDGYITFDDLKAVAKELKEPMTDEEIEEMLRSASKNQDSNGEYKVAQIDFFNILQTQQNQ